MRNSRRAIAVKPAQKNEGLSGDPLEIRRILRRAAEAQVQVVLQPRDQSERFYGRLESIDEENRKYFLRFTSADATRVRALSKNSGSNEVLIAIFVKGKHLVCIRTKWQIGATDSFEFPYPDRIYKLQRRKDLRYLIPSGYEISVLIRKQESQETLIKSGRSVTDRPAPSPVPSPAHSPAHSKETSWPLLDISASGLAFRVSDKKDLAFFPKGRDLRRISLTLRGRRIVFDAQVRNHVPFLMPDGTQEFKVGVEFERILKDDVDYIDTFVVMQLAQSAV